MILGYSRKIYGELIERADPQTFLDCHIRAFEYFGGVPEQLLYDRMKNVFIGKIAGKKKFNDTLLGFALHYGFKPEVASAYAAWVKVLDYITFYNAFRRHSTINYMSPMAFEQKYIKQAA